MRCFSTVASAQNSGSVMRRVQRTIGMDFVQSRSLSSLVLQSSMRRFSLTAILFVFGCVHQRPPELSPSTVAMHRTLAVYRTIAESIYVHTTGRVIAVATAPLDTACTEP